MTHAMRPAARGRTRGVMTSLVGLMLLLGVCVPVQAYQQPIPNGPVDPPQQFPPDRPAFPPPRVTVQPEVVQTLTGEVVGTAPNRITFSNNEIYEQSFLITEDSEIILNSKPVPLTELRTGDAVKITINRINPKIAQHIRAARIVPDPRVRVGTLPRRTARNLRPEQSEQDAGLGVIVASSPGEGVLVLGVDPRSPAKLAGIQIGDYIVSFAGESVSEAEILVSLIRDREPGGNVELAIWRDGERMNRRVTLVERGQATDATRSETRLDLIAVSSEALREGEIVPPQDVQPLPQDGPPTQNGSQTQPNGQQPNGQQPPAQDPAMQTLIQEIQALQKQMQELRQQVDGIRKSEATEGTSI